MILGFGDGTAFDWWADCPGNPALAFWWYCAPDCLGCIDTGEKVAAELAAWHCTECGSVPDEGVVSGTCADCMQRGHVENAGCYWCGPGVMATDTDKDGHDVCLGCSLDDDDAFDDSDPGDDDYDSDYSDE